jgi:two-component system response regulator FixJ
VTTDPTVFIVDDDHDARESLAVLLGSSGIRAESYPSAETFLGEFDAARPGCLVVDYKMPGMNGLDLQESLAARASRLPVIVVTGYADVPMTVRAMESGALTLLEKPCSSDLLLGKIRVALVRNAQIRRLSADQEEANRRLAGITTEERAVLELLIAGKGNKQVAAELNIGLRTAELRRARLLEKAGVESIPELIQLVIASRGPIDPLRQTA